jgi:surfactin synthase thioesterase subunit
MFYTQPPPPLLQGKPYALFGTCLGAIVAYEVAKRVADRKHAPMPLALFPAAVSPPHLYALAVMKLYVQHAVGERSSLLGICAALHCSLYSVHI